VNIRLAVTVKRANADRIAEAAMFMENRSRYVQQSANTRTGKPAELPPRQLAPLVGNRVGACRG
jgi:hypothetical protein